jgi:hypothetical protein
VAEVDRQKAEVEDLRRQFAEREAILIAGHEEVASILDNTRQELDGLRAGTREGAAMPFGRELREVLTAIDSKYPFDSLRSALHGNDELVTLKGLVSELFFALNKVGFAQYPDRDEFELHYEQSGLYECYGFEIPPSHSRRVRVEKKGWALRRGQLLQPVRKARVVPCPAELAQEPASRSGGDEA